MTIILAYLLAISFRTFAYEPFNIPSGSMEPTLMIGDYLFVSKFSYGYSRFSAPFANASFTGRLLGHLPMRGDVVVFKLPQDTSIDYIKRVIGLPGDHVQIKGGELSINGAVVPRQRVQQSEPSGASIEGRVYSEALPNGRTHDLKKLTDAGFANNTPDFVVPANHLFVLGDNRDNSADSRFTGVGFVPLENLVGRAEFLFFSANTTHRWWDVPEWPAEIRWSRLLSPIR